MKKIKYVIIVFLGFIQNVQSQNLVFNPSFELLSGSLVGYCPTHFTQGYVPGWHQFAGSSNIIPAAAPALFGITPYDGNQMAYCVGFVGNSCPISNEAIYADVNLVAGHIYKLSFALRTFFYYFPPSSAPYEGRYYVQLDDNEISTSICSVCGAYPAGGAQTIVNNYFTDLSAENNGWVIFNQYFVANGNYTQLKFLPYFDDPNDQYFGMYIDLVEMYDLCEDNVYLEVTNGIISGDKYYIDYIKVGSLSSNVVQNDPNNNTHLVAGNYIEMLNVFEAVPTTNHFFLAEIDPDLCRRGDRATDINIKPEEELGESILAKTSKTTLQIVNREVFLQSIDEDIFINRFSLYTIDGKLLIEYFDSKLINFNMADYANGIYFYLAELSDGSYVSDKIFLN